MTQFRTIMRAQGLTNHAEDQMHFTFFSRHLLAATLTLSAACSLAQNDPITCTDYNAVQQSADFQFPQQQRFRRFINNVIALDTPYHMGHDRVVKTGTATTLTGKFDYGAVFHKDLEGERVQAFLTGTGKSGWENLGTFTTNSDGKIFIPVDGQQEGQYIVRMVVLGDLTYADAYLSAVKPGTKAVVFDIDETLTTSDLQQVFDYIGLTTAEARSGAPRLVREYMALGYQPIYITARTYWQAKDTREWFRDAVNLPDFILRTTLSNNISLNQTADYKAGVLKEFQNAGMEFIRAYGNADTDAEAFAAAGVPLSETYMIGENAGINGTQPINGAGYLQHIDDVVLNTEHSGCQTL